MSFSTLSPSRMPASTLGERKARAIFDTDPGAGEDLLDTTDVYSGGKSKAMLARLLKDSWIDDRLVASTMSGFSRSQGHPVHGGNGTFNIRQAMEGLLRGDPRQVMADPDTGATPRFLSTKTLFGTAIDRTRAALTREGCCPADEATRAALKDKAMPICKPPTGCMTVRMGRVRLRQVNVEEPQKHLF